jgi:hypothetical protein
MKCAVVGNDNVVSNLIVASSLSDATLENTFLVSIPDDVLVNVGWVYNVTDQTFFDPNPPPPRVEPIVAPVEGVTP